MYLKVYGRMIYIYTHDLGLIFGMYEKCELLFKQFGIVGKDIYGKCFILFFLFVKAYFGNW